MKLLIAAGGTGGHLFPGIALAAALKERDPLGEILFVGTERGLEKEILEQHGLTHEALTVGRIKGVGWAGRLRTLTGLPAAFLRARAILLRFTPGVVFGIGGYSSGPVILAALSIRIPCAILEPNAIPGFTNRMLGHLVQRVFIAFPEAARFFPKGRVRLTGTPVRKNLQPTPRPTFKTDQDVFTLLVMGGSQGAHSLNQAVVDLLPVLEKSGKNFRIIHQAGIQDHEWIQKATQKTKIASEAHSFIEDMAAAYRQADLVIGRAGASTVAELMQTQTPSILVPYPFAADDHQRFNALSLVRSGAAEMILTKDLKTFLAPKVLHYEEHREDLAKMKEALGALQKRSAVDSILEEYKNLSFT